MSFITKGGIGSIVGRIKKPNNVFSLFGFSYSLNIDSYFAASIDTLRNSFNAFSIAKDVFLARVPAALFPLSTCNDASFWKSAIRKLMFSTKFFIVFYFLFGAKIIIIISPTHLSLNIHNSILKIRITDIHLFSYSDSEISP